MLENIAKGKQRRAMLYGYIRGEKMQEMRAIEKIKGKREMVMRLDMRKDGNRGELI